LCKTTDGNANERKKSKRQSRIDDAVVCSG